MWGLGSEPLRNILDISAENQPFRDHRYPMNMIVSDTPNHSYNELFMIAFLELGNILEIYRYMHMQKTISCVCLYSRKQFINLLRECMCPSQMTPLLAVVLLPSTMPSYAGNECGRGHGCELCDVHS